MKRNRLRVLLIKPPVEGFYALTAGSRHVPVGLMYLAHTLRQYNVDVKMFDSLIWTSDTHIVPNRDLSSISQKKVQTSPLFKNVVHFGSSWHRMYQAISELQPDIVGITCLFSPYYRQAYRTIKIVRHACPHAIVLMGGPHATVCWQDVFEHTSVNAVVLGEGEQTFAKMVVDLQSSNLRDIDALDVSSYPGLIIRCSDGELKMNQRQVFVEDLDDLGFPTLDDMDFEPYHGITSLITSRGCPFSCTFCSVHAIVGKAFRARSVSSVLEELKYYTQKGVHTFNIEDDNFTFDMDRVDQIMEGICSANLKIELRFPNGITAIKMTKERIRLLSQAGVRQLFFGLESTNVQTRKSLKKSFAKMDKVEELIHIALAEGIYAFASLIIGLPGQTLEDIINEFVEVFLRGIGASANPYYPIVGTELFNQMKKEGLLMESDLEWYEPMNFPIWSHHFDRSDIAEAFVLGLTLSHAGYKRYHRKFLQSTRFPSSQEVLEALNDLEVLVSAKGMDELKLTPFTCFCKEQNLTHRHLSNHTTTPVVEPCALAGKVLQTVLQLWTQRSYEYTTLNCCVTEPVGRCVFLLRAVPFISNRAVNLFLQRLHDNLQDSTLTTLDGHHDQLALEGYNSYIHLGY